MTGMILEDLKSVWTGKVTYFRAMYCDQEEKVLDIAQGAKEMSGAPVVLVKLPCCEGNEATSCVSCVLVHA